jgi:hypothetical protein
MVLAVHKNLVDGFSRSQEFLWMVLAVHKNLVDGFSRSQESCGWF